NTALNTPILSNVNPKYTVDSPTGDYDTMRVQISLGKIAVTIKFIGNGEGIGDLLSTTVPTGERICTVTLNISNLNALAGVSWDTTNSAMQTVSLQNITNNYQGSYESPLPVELSSFTGKADGDKSIDLKWVTKTEVSNYGFNVERRINEGEWNTLGFVKGNGNSNSPKQYSYTDNDLFAGSSKFQYRLKQIDTDGQFEYSDAIEVEIVPTQFELSQNYPNPFNPSTTIRFSLPKETRLKINIYNLLGQLVETLAEGNYEAGYHKVTFNASFLPSGAYIYRIESDAFVQVKKMMLLK
ncbi:T9SS type A sorting domain-containing protein, partial [Ignavibacterium album]|uniref:T9SS type A sorting domain-containing protein n=1 Tax=Ignavibacterium album TaxID=591197 RepID=UPI0038B3995F